MADEPVLVRVTVSANLLNNGGWLTNAPRVILIWLVTSVAPQAEADCFAGEGLGPRWSDFPQAVPAGVLAATDTSAVPFPVPEPDAITHGNELLTAHLHPAGRRYVHISRAAGDGECDAGRADAVSAARRSKLCDRNGKGRR